MTTISKSFEYFVGFLRRIQRLNTAVLEWEIVDMNFLGLTFIAGGWPGHEPDRTKSGVPLLGLGGWVLGFSLRFFIPGRYRTVHPGFPLLDRQLLPGHPSGCAPIHASSGLRAYTELLSFSYGCCVTLKPPPTFENRACQIIGCYPPAEGKSKLSHEGFLMFLFRRFLETSASTVAGPSQGCISSAR